MLGRYEDGTIVQIGKRRFALQAWDDEDQRCPDEVVYSGYSRDEWRLAVEASAIVIQTMGEWAFTSADNYNERFHDDGGLRVVGGWAGGKSAVVGDAHELW